MNDEEMRSFFASVAGEANTRPALPAMPDGFVLMAHGVGAYEGRGGWKIAQAHVPARMASVQLARDGQAERRRARLGEVVGEGGRRRESMRRRERER